MFSEFSTDGGQTANMNAMLEQMALHRALWTNNQAGAMQALAAVEGGSIVFWDYDLSAQAPVRAIFQQGNNLYIHVGGTNQEISGNLANIMGTLASTSYSATVYTNSWFDLMQRLIEPGLIAAMPAGWQTMQLHFVGHSQGAAVSLMIAVSWANQFGAVNYDWFGFAAPRAFASSPIPQNLLPRWGFVIVNGQDAVPRLPPNDLIWAIGLNPANPITWGAAQNWYHTTPIGTMPGDGTISYIEPGGSEPGLTPSALAALLTYHPLPMYANQVVTLWDRNNA